MPLAFEPGEEAQVDWHEGWIEENGVRRKAQFLRDGAWEMLGKTVEASGSTARVIQFNPF